MGARQLLSEFQEAVGLRCSAYSEKSLARPKLEKVVRLDWTGGLDSSGGWLLIENWLLEGSKVIGQ